MKRTVLPLVAVLGLAAVPSMAGTASLPLDSVLSAPFADLLVASSDGKRLAWSIHERGARNVVVWSGTAMQRVTHDDADDGQEIDALQFVRDEPALVFERGGSGSSAGAANADPRASAVRAKRRITVVPLGGAPLVIGDGIQPIVQPKPCAGDAVPAGSIAVEWLAGGQLMESLVSSLGATPKATEAAPLFAVRGAITQAVWSPDGCALAFVNARDDHGFVGVYRRGAAAPVFLGPTFHTDAFPVWAPDGHALAFVRMPAQRMDASGYDALTPDQDPWSILVADPATGATRQVWKAQRGRGVTLSIADGGTPLVWSTAGLAFIWERDNRRHLYTVAPSGGTARLVTPGEFDIEQTALDRDNNRVIFTSNKDDIDRRHVWTVDLRGGAPQALTHGPHDQWNPVSLANGAFAYEDAGYAAPPAVTLTAAGAAPVAIGIAPDPRTSFDETAFVEPHLVTFGSKDGLTIHGQLFLPRDGRAKHPAMIFVHGGPERQMLPGFHYFEAYSNLYEMNQYLVSRGFVVLSVNYRSGIMYGHDFQNAPKWGPFGASEYADVLAGATFLKQRADVRADRLGIYGLSYGGYLTALSLARNSDIFAAGVDIAGVHDWRQLMGAGPWQLVGSAAQQNVAYHASPVADIDHWRSPVFLSQGDDDRNVPFAQGTDIAQRLRDRGVDVTEMVFPDELHENLVYAHELQLYGAAAAFLEAKLMR